LDDIEKHCFAALVAFGALHASFFGPAAIAIHDHCNMAWQELCRDLWWSKNAVGIWGNHDLLPYFNCCSITDKALTFRSKCHCKCARINWCASPACATVASALCPWAIRHMMCRVSVSTSAAPGGRHLPHAAPPIAGWKAWWGQGAAHVAL